MYVNFFDQDQRATGTPNRHRKCLLWPCICLSVCLPQVGVLQIVETYHYANNIAIGFWSSDVKRICEIPVGYSQQGRQIQVAYEKLRLSTNSYISLYLKKCENRHIDSVIDEQEEQNTLSNGDIVDDLEWP